MTDHIYSVDRLSIQADGVIRSEEGTIHAPLTLPQEDITGEVVAGRIAQPKIVNPSASRVRPPCPHYRACGGCSLQHASDAFVADWKASVIETALAARDIDAKVEQVFTSPANSRRRATLSGRRTKKGAQVGFHGRASGTITEITGCTLLRPELLAHLPTAEALTIAGASRKGELSMTLTLSEAGVEIACTGGKEISADLFTTLSEIAHKNGLARISWNGEMIAAIRPAWQAMGRAQVAPPAGAFLQATKEGETALTDFVLQNLGKAAKVVDLFSGSGTFTLPLAQYTDVHAVEAEAPMLEALDQGWRKAQGLHRVTHEARDLFRRPLLPDELDRFDVIVIDPPRAGAESQIAEICRSDATRVLHVSCNPITFSRDAKTLLEAGFVLEKLIAVDQFRWSAHIEIAALFTRC
ncbi:class I SAM-dependent RNA methyltransferase [Thioclava sp. GXIMD4216]|uniref:class I SAM-dependent RNA methyltransferase n=1 Tax=Thioclava sp. GXIMD4216 TaxID=3131929 RepID=UPI0030D4D5B2